VFLENVPGLWPDGFAVVENDLRAAGYVVSDPLLASAADLGATQRRMRLWTLAYLRRDGLGLQWLRRVLHEFGQTFRDHADGRGEDVGDMHGGGRETHGAEQPVWQRSTSSIRTNCPFPPGRNPEHWRGIAPEDQPAIPGVAHGVADWVERVRTTGAGLVPVVAAAAFVVLAAMAIGEEGAR